MSTVYFLFAVSCPHFFPRELNKTYYRRPITEASLGSQRSYKLVSKCNSNAPIYPVFPGLLMSIDDTTVFVLKGKTDCIKRWYLISGSGSNNNEGTHSWYSSEVGSTNNLNSLRVRLQ